MPFNIGDYDFQNPFSLQDLEGDPFGERAIFEQARPGFLRTGSQRNLFSDMFSQIKNDFARTIGQAFAEGNEPPTSFTDFVNNRDFGREIRRGGGSRRETPLISAANFLYNR